MAARHLYKVRVEKPNGKRVVYRVIASTSQQAAAQKQGKGRVISSQKAG
jgi:hypothetical protein